MRSKQLLWIGIVLLLFFCAPLYAKSFIQKEVKEAKRVGHRVEAEVNRTDENLKEGWDATRDFVQKNTESFQSWDAFIDMIAVSGIQRLLGILSGVFGGCDFDSIHTIETMCFTSGQRKLIKETLDFMGRDPNSYWKVGRPLVFAKNHLGFMMNPHAGAVQAVIPGAAGRHDFSGAHGGGKSGTTLLSNYFFNAALTQRAAILIHEGAHATEGAHTCGTWADKDSTKPYGIEIRYLAQLASANVQGLDHCADRFETLNFSMYWDEYHICVPQNRVNVLSNYPIPCQTEYRNACDEYNVRGGEIIDGRWINMEKICQVGFDRDKDGIGNRFDNCPNDPNYWQTDTDKDSVGNGCDNCYLLYNPDQWDMDGDGIGDECDEQDLDGDGITGSGKWGYEGDNCPRHHNPDQWDTDRDKRGDVCDDDDDGDLVLDLNDNCPLYKNKDQKDSDGDGKGDLCDNFFGIDSDNDYVADSRDNCPLRSNWNQRDTDWDNKGDACDNCPYIVNTDQKDSDNDGIGDVCDITPVSVVSPVVTPPASYQYYPVVKRSSGGSPTYFKIKRRW